MLALVGSYTTPDRKGRGAGITLFRVPGPGKAWEMLGTLDVGDNPSMLRLSADARMLYVAHGGRDRVSAWAVDPATGALAGSSEADAGGNNPVDMAVDVAHDALIVANYGGGTVGHISLEPGGGLGALSESVVLRGTPGPDTTEQASAHPHGVHLDPARRFAVVPDKGLDRVFVFRLGVDGLEQVEAAPTAAGAGPRHAAFHPTRPKLYVLNELNASIEVFRWDGATGKIEPDQVISTLPAGASGWNACAEILATPDGRFVYASNRGHDSIAAYAVEPGGRLRWLGCTSVGGRGPRFFALDPAGTGLYVANQDSDTLTFMQCDGDGLPGAAVIVAQTGSPSTIVFLA